MADHPETEPAGVGGLAARYEQLRQVALAGQAEGWRHGLGVLATRGMTGWMTACTSVSPAPPTRGGVDASTLGPQAAELVAVMAAMALAHT